MKLKVSSHLNEAYQTRSLRSEMDTFINERAKDYGGKPERYLYSDEGIKELIKLTLDNLKTSLDTINFLMNRKLNPNNHIYPFKYNYSKDYAEIMRYLDFVNGIFTDMSDCAKKATQVSNSKFIDFLEKLVIGAKSLQGKMSILAASYISEKESQELVDDCDAAQAEITALHRNAKDSYETLSDGLTGFLHANTEKNGEEFDKVYDRALVPATEKYTKIPYVNNKGYALVKTVLGGSRKKLNIDKDNTMVFPLSLADSTGYFAINSKSIVRTGKGSKAKPTNAGKNIIKAFETITSINNAYALVPETTTTDILGYKVGDTVYDTNEIEATEDEYKNNHYNDPTWTNFKKHRHTSTNPETGEKEVSYTYTKGPRNAQRVPIDSKEETVYNPVQIPVSDYEPVYDDNDEYIIGVKITNKNSPALKGAKFVAFQFTQTYQSAGYEEEPVPFVKFDREKDENGRIIADTEYSPAGLSYEKNGNKLKSTSSGHTPVSRREFNYDENGDITGFTQYDNLNTKKSTLGDKTSKSKATQVSTRDFLNQFFTK